jgi:hypothetical protein
MIIQSVYKYLFEVQDEFEIEMPENAKLLSVQTQKGIPCLWALGVNTSVPLEKRKFRLAGTGHPILSDGKIEYKFIGTFQLYDGDFIGHLFEILK